MRITRFILTGVFATAMISSTFAGLEIVQDTSEVKAVPEVVTIEEVEAVEEVEETKVSEVKEDDGVLAKANISKAHKEAIGDEAEGRKEIKLTALPPAITEVLNSEPYLDCKVKKAYVIEENNEKTYEIHVKRGALNETLYFDDQGTEVKK